MSSISLLFDESVTVTEAEAEEEEPLSAIHSTTSGSATSFTGSELDSIRLLDDADGDDDTPPTRLSMDSLTKTWAAFTMTCVVAELPLRFIPAKHQHWTAALTTLACVFLSTHVRLEAFLRNALRTLHDVRHHEEALLDLLEQVLATLDKKLERAQRRAGATVLLHAMRAARRAVRTALTRMVRQAVVWHWMHLQRSGCTTASKIEIKGE